MWSKARSGKPMSEGGVLEGENFEFASNSRGSRGRTGAGLSGVDHRRTGEGFAGVGGPRRIPPKT